MTDILIIVRPGVRVRYMESEQAPENDVFALDLTKLESSFGVALSPALQLFDAEQYREN